MKIQKFYLNYKNKKFKIDLKVCNWFKRITGLMFTRREKARALLFDFKKPTKIAIHSCFVFFPFIAIWLDHKNKIIDLKIVQPFTFFICPRKPCFKLIEIPINRKYKKVAKLLFSSMIENIKG